MSSPRGWWNSESFSMPLHAAAPLFPLPVSATMEADEGRRGGSACALRPTGMNLRRLLHQGKEIGAAPRTPPIAAAGGRRVWRELEDGNGGALQEDGNGAGEECWDGGGGCWWPRRSVTATAAGEGNPNPRLPWKRDVRRGEMSTGVSDRATLRRRVAQTRSYMGWHFFR
jgi:hypothetical protein